MDFLDNVQTGGTDDIFESIDEEIVEVEEEIEDIGSIIEDVVESEPSKDVSVKIIESRIRLKLDEVGFDEELVDEIVNEVFKGVNAVRGMDTKQTTVKESIKPMTIASRAESILGGMSDPSSGYQPQMSSPVGGGSRLSGVADRASSLL